MTRRVRKCKAAPQHSKFVKDFRCRELCCEICQSRLNCLWVGLIPSPLCHLVSSVSKDAGSHDAMDLEKPSNLLELHAVGGQQILSHGLGVYLLSHLPFDFPNPHLFFVLFLFM